MGLSQELMHKLNRRDAGKRVFDENQKLLDKLMKLERDLVHHEREKTKDYLRQEGEKFERHCRCHEKKDKKLSQIAKHYLYHKPNPNMKWPV